MATSNTVFTAFRAWLVVLSTSLFFFFEFGLNNIFNVLEPYLSRDYHLGATAMGAISSVYFYANVAALIPAGLLLDRFSPKGLILSATAVCIASLLGIAYSHNIPLLCIARLLMGLGGGFCFIGVMRIVVNWIPMEKMAFAAGLVVTMGMLGGFMVQAPMTLLIQTIGWRCALVGVAGVGLVVFLVIAALVQDHAPWHHEESLANRATLKSLPLSQSLKIVFLNPQNWLAGLYTGLINLPIFILGALWGIPYLSNVHGMTETQASSIAGMLFIGSMIGCPLVGMLSDKLGSKKILMLLGAIISFGIAAWVIFSHTSNVYELLILFCLLGMITSTQILSYPLVAAGNPKMVSSTAISVISMMCLGGGAIAQPLFGKILSWNWNGAMRDGTPVYAVSGYQHAAELLLVSFALGFILALWIRESK